MDSTVDDDSETTILDLNDDCLEAICEYLDEFELYVLRDTHNRFAYATENRFKKMMESEDFDFEGWLYEKPPDIFIKNLKYFGHCFTRFKIDERFMKLVKRESVSKSFLSECLRNVCFLELEYDDHEEISFVSTLKHIQELELTSCTGWLLFNSHWPDLHSLNILISTIDRKFDEAFAEMFRRNPPSHSVFAGVRQAPNAYAAASRSIDPWISPDDILRKHYDPKFIVKLSEFFSKHKHIRKFGIDSTFLERGCYWLDEEHFIEAIAANLCNLKELKICTNWSNENLKKIFNWSNLQALTIDELPDIESLISLKNLKSLKFYEKKSIEDLCRIVEICPTLTLLQVNYDMDALDNEALEKLIQKRKLSPYCESELLRIESPHDFGYTLQDYHKYNEKYVSCVYKWRERTEYEEYEENFELESDHYDML